MRLDPDDFKWGHYGEAVAILGNGPGLLSVPRTLSMPTIGVNRSYKFKDSAYHCVLDTPFIEQINRGVWVPAGVLFSWCNNLEVTNKDVVWVRMHPKPAHWPIHPKGPLYASSYTGPLAIELALWMGFRTIYLCGFNSVDHEGNFDVKRVSHVYGEQRTYMPELKKLLPRIDPTQDVRIFNATPGSAIECFPFIDPKELS